MLEIRDLGKTYRGGDGVVVALESVSLSVAPGELAAVRGQSGCGKTTLLLAAGALLEPTSGHVRIDGRDPYDLPSGMRARFRAERVGFVFQQFHLVPYLSVLENVLAPSLALPSAKARERAEGLVERFGLTARSAHVPGELSTGERQRTALARAMMNEPKLLLADEPTGNLDADSAEEVLNALSQFADAGGAVMLVTHDPRAMGRAARNFQLSGGRLSEA
jgi:ABC-type lipoprotein export system ATPase subunit